MSAIELPPDSHWCPSLSCEDGWDCDREDYMTVCRECDGKGYVKCNDDLDCDEHTPVPYARPDAESEIFAYLAPPWGLG